MVRRDWNSWKADATLLELTVMIAVAEFSEAGGDIDVTEREQAWISLRIHLDHPELDALVGKLGMKLVDRWGYNAWECAPA